MIELLHDVGHKEPECECVVRLTTNYWHNRDGINIKKSLRFLKRKCIGYNILYEDAEMAGTESIIPNIVNFDKCKDGVYKVITVNHYSSWETPGIIEDYNYKLIPYEIPKH